MNLNIDSGTLYLDENPGMVSGSVDQGGAPFRARRGDQSSLQCGP